MGWEDSCLTHVEAGYGCVTVDFLSMVNDNQQIAMCKQSIKQGSYIDSDTHIKGLSRNTSLKLSQLTIVIYP